MKIVKNYLYNVSFQMYSILVPIITTPYISRVLGVSGIGINEYALSIVQLFVIFGMLGTLTYGNKEISKNKGNKIETLAAFVSIYLNQLFTCLISLIIYFIVISTYFKDNMLIFSIQSIYILAAALDISWYFQGKEEFSKTVRRGMLSKTLGVILMFLFVKDSSDTNVYAFILVVSYFIGQILMWTFFLKEYEWKSDLKKVKSIISFSEIIKHLKGTFSLFLPVIGMQIYSILDRSILGSFSGVIETGYYSNAVKIVRIPLYIVTSLGIVMLPRISYELKNKNFQKVEMYLKSSVQIMLFNAIPLTFGMIIIANNFVPWFFGAGFNKISILIPILAFMIIPRTITNILGIQLLVPSQKNKEYTIAITMGAISSIILNLILVPMFQSIGTAISAVIAESIVMLSMLFFTREYKQIFFEKDLIKYAFSGICMFIIVNSLNYFYLSPIVLTIIQILVGMIVYFTVCFLLKCNVFVKIKTLNNNRKKK